jgi:hexosaminidase
VTLSTAAQNISIIPRPTNLKPGDGAFTLQSTTTIITDRATNGVGRLLADALAPATGYKLRLHSGGVANSARNVIVLHLDPALSRLGDEGYTLDVTPERVMIRAAKAGGVFYGMQSLRQLFPPQIFARERQPGLEWRAPAVTIEDSPRFGWRGAMLDVCRHFRPVEDVLKFIDLLAIHKMNSFHWHLTDDQGWRIEIKRYPKLTSVGSMRKETRVGHELSKENKGFDGKPHGGFYTQADIRRVVAYARERFINIVPEIEMPGHAQAALAGYPELGNTGEKVEVGTYWGIYKHVFNADEPTIVFLQNVLKEVLTLFPSKFIHVGGDEVLMDEWKASPAAQARMKALGLKDEHELQSYFIKRMDEFLTSQGRRLIGWDEILEGGLAPGATVMSWRGVKGGIAAARAGHDVVMSSTTHLYFDYAQSKDPGEPLSIGGFVPFDKVYSFDPVPSELTAAEAKHILGAQCQLWTEYMPTMSQVEYMAYPRICALSEVVWTPKEGKNWENFDRRMDTHEQRLRALGVNFRPRKK